MSIRAGLVGLPNVGKSSLFNALTKSSVPAENYPFCTIDPHIACTYVPDDRVEKLKEIYSSLKTIRPTVEFVDIAGLVKGAASGQGLGNQFLSHIREVDLILHVLRCFDDANITNTQDKLDPISDYEIIVTELMLKDLESLDKRQVKLGQLIKQSKSNPLEFKKFSDELILVEKLITIANSSDVNLFRKTTLDFLALGIETIPLLVSKNFLIIANVSESEVAQDAYKNNLHFKKLIEVFGHDRVVAVSARLEYDLSQLDDASRVEMQEMMGLQESGLNKIISTAYAYLGLITFFTCGPKEIHSWPIKAGITIRKAAGEIHSDLEKGFICSEVFNYKDLIAAGAVAKLKDIGKLRTEGQDYIVADGDIVHIKFNV